MDYSQFENIFNKNIFKDSKINLIDKIVKYPERYSSLFRPTKPKAKIIQNLSQSHEIRFGDAFEILIEEYLKETGFSILDKNLINQKLKLDQFFQKGNNIFFVEQKIRDDHDSTKKRGQIDNFEKKLKVILKKYHGKNIEGFFYFIDDSFSKNKNYYQKEMKDLSAYYNTNLHLMYGKNFFKNLNIENIWDEIIINLKKWKKNIPDLPEINFDKNANETFQEIKFLPANIFKKLFSNSNLDAILKVLFPENKTLKLLCEHFISQYNKNNQMINRTLYDLCLQKIEQLKNL